MSTTKEKYQMKRLEQEADKWKQTAKLKGEECAALQQGTANKTKMMQQQLNRLEQELLETKALRDALQRDYQDSLRQLIEQGKSSASSAESSVASTLDRVSKEAETLRAALDKKNVQVREAELRADKSAEEADSLRSECAALKRAAVRSGLMFGATMKAKRGVVVGDCSGALAKLLCSELCEFGAVVTIVDWDAARAAAFAKDLTSRGLTAQALAVDASLDACKAAVLGGGGSDVVDFVASFLPANGSPFAEASALFLKQLNEAAAAVGAFVIVCQEESNQHKLETKGRLNTVVVPSEFDAEEVVATVVFFLSDASKCLNGQEIRVVRK